MQAKISNANFPLDAEGRTYHLSTAPGDLANRLLIVGDPARLHRLAPLLDATPVPRSISSHRGFVTLTGRYNGVPVSLVAIGMGVAMVDFLGREARQSIEGEMVIIRFGSCGSLDPLLQCGSVGVPKEAMMISTDYDHLPGDPTTSGYRFSHPIQSDSELHHCLLSALQSSPLPLEVHAVDMHASADCFYSSQGRVDPSFADDNAQLIGRLTLKGVRSLEMETAHLFHLARLAVPSHERRKGSIKVAAVHITFAARTNNTSLFDHSPADGSIAAAGGYDEEQEEHVELIISPADSGYGKLVDSAYPGVHSTGGKIEDVSEDCTGGAFITPAEVERLEPRVGRACLEALSAFPIAAENLHSEVGSAWAL